jgi:8-oxo-dGTP diphosphatase
VHVFRGELLRPLEELKLLEGQDWTLASLSELRSETIWSKRCGEFRPMVAGLSTVVQKLLAEANQNG